MTQVHMICKETYGIIELEGRRFRLTIEQGAQDITTQYAQETIKQIGQTLYATIQNKPDIGKIVAIIPNDQ